jgi:2-polyprenyl-3-methyl-5-hydroxy-6-metoxy-1,4-benzoquinol methylase
MWELLKGVDYGRYGDMEAGIAWYLSQINLNNAERIAVYGAGRFGRALLRYLREFNPSVYGKIVCVIDKSRHGGINGLNAMSLSDALESFSFDTVLITVARYDGEIFNELSAVLDGNIAIVRYPSPRKGVERLHFENFNLLIFAPNELLTHANRYMFAMPFCIGRDVLDTACGEGYVSNLMAKRARRVVGVDIDEHAVAYARANFLQDNIRFVRKDCTALDMKEEFDVIVSFETLEHIPAEKTDAYFMNLKQRLNANGIFIVSTPFTKNDGKSLFNEYHINEMAIETFKETVARYFADVEYHYQEMKGLGAIIPECFTDISDYEPYELTVIAVCYCEI